MGGDTSGSPDIEDLLFNPEYYLNGIDLDAKTCDFLKIDKSAYQRSAFMDHRLQSSIKVPVHAPLNSLSAAAQTKPDNAPAGPCSYIFHTSFCCSTLLSHCLQMEGAALTIREPSVLMQLANLKRVPHPEFASQEQQHALLSMASRLLSKSTGAGEAVVIKPTNVANNLIEDIARYVRPHGILFLYSNLEYFLVSIAKKNEGGRAFVRHIFNIIRSDSPRTSAVTHEAMAKLTDLQMAAFVWYTQIDNFLQLLAMFPGYNIRTLNCDAFLVDPQGVLEKVCKLFDIKTTSDRIHHIINGPIFTRSSKNNDRAYTPRMRQDEYNSILEKHRESIESVLAWSDQIHPGGPIRLPLPMPLQ